MNSFVVALLTAAGCPKKVEVLLKAQMAEGIAFLSRMKAEAKNA
jgi:hypothetical protein